MSVYRDKDGSLWKYNPSPPVDDMEYMRRHAAGERECPVCHGDGYEFTWSIEDAETIPLEPTRIKAVNVGSRLRPWFVPAQPACTFCEGAGWVLSETPPPPNPDVPTAQGDGSTGDSGDKGDE